MAFESSPGLIVIVGPTGAGKSTLAVDLSLAIGGEVVNCDSLQFYRGMDIGTAKIRPEERKGIPHHLFDFLNPDQVFTAGDYARAARPLLAEISGRGRVPVVCGGAGFYVRALLDGLSPSPTRDQALRERFQQADLRRPGVMYRYLRRADPVAAARIAPTDLHKVIRAAEICWQARRPATELFTEMGRSALAEFRALQIGLDPPREQLYQRLNQRTRNMFTTGLVEEIQGLLAQGYLRESKAFESVGYRQALAYLESSFTFEQAVSDTAQRTRNYAKRQWTWFRKDTRIQWFSGFGDDPVMFTEVSATVHRFLTGN